ncbi:RHO1 GDP-GTP exchange protein 2 [Diatrype stigma]|uniref:RHO1 GDP-GTP exchange protein 2 n=1 Tax=Diatrype stigma TaxID=117547 RepID=A0AAN9UW87_9PEZI
MADYQYDQRRYGPPPNHPQRDAAFSNIFGSAPPPGRTTTMTSASSGNLPPMPHPSGRTNTMSGAAPDMRMPPPRPQRGPYEDSGRTRTMDSSMAGGYYQNQRNPSGGYPPPGPGYGRPAPVPDRRPYGGPLPPRPDPRGPPAGYPPRAPPPRNYAGGPGPLPGPGPGSGPALRDDPYRSQSLASVPRQPMYQPPPGSYQPPQSGFRHAPQHHPGASRTTAQGRVVPERHDDRSMSMTGYPPPDRDAHQTMSGRIIPNRARAPSNDDESMSSYAPLNGYTPAPGTATRTMSMASSTVAGDHSRTMSMASTIVPSEQSQSQSPAGSQHQPLGHRPSVASTGSGGGERPPTARIRAPLVYPALLSKVGECFRQKIITGDRTKNGLTYKNAFSGSEAVDVLSYIIRTTDRNLALLLGRALDAQKFFHDVTYEHRLRDSTSEMYQFRETMMDEPEEKPAVNGVFVLLSECYSPTCTRDQLCYSIACPRRLEQVSRLNLKPQVGLKKEQDILNDDADQTDEQKLWINTVPKEIAESVGDREKKRQEVISEICYTERDFVKDLEYLRDFWILPLRSNGSPIPTSRRDRVVRNIFSNVIDHPSIHSVSSRFARALTERQQKHPVVKNIGDIFLEIVPQFEPFILYGSKQMEAKFGFENERSNNPNFAKYVDEIERRKESRKLELNGYLTKPTTRLARYPLLLENVLKYTEDGNPDKEDIPKVMTMIRALLTRVNAESGKAENRFNLSRLNEQLRFRPQDRVDLKLTDEGRDLVFKTQFKKSPTDPTDITAFLFDHAVLLVRIKQVGKGQEEVKAYRRPIPLELLSIKEMDEVIPRQGVKRASSSLPSLGGKATDKKGAEGWPITFRHLGRNFYEQVLYASNQAARKKWLEYIDAAQQRLRARADFFNVNTLSTAGFFQAGNQVNAVTPFDGGRKLIYGTDNGIYVSSRKNKDQPPKRVIEAQSVTQVDVLEEYGLLLILSNKSLMSYPIAALDPNEPALSKRPKKIQSHCNFFKTGICLGRHLVCCVKSSALSTTIKVYEPNDQMNKGKKQKGFGSLFNSGQDELKAFKEFYIPTESTSVHFLKSKLCVACARGFEVVSLETLETQSLLDQADTSLDFVARKEGVKPIHIERLNGEFLLNYTDFSFFVNRNGWRARPEWRIDWEGMPQAFALSYPWILAFEPNFIELRNIENGAVHIVPHKNIRMLHSSSHEVSLPNYNVGVTV